MKTKHLPLALVIACIFSTWINSARAAGTNILQIQNSTVITYTKPPLPSLVKTVNVLSV